MSRENLLWRAANKAKRVVLGGTGPVPEPASGVRSAFDRGGKPDVSIVIVAYNIPRQAQRSLYALSTSYQRHIRIDDYEVIVVDNGSSPPLDSALVYRQTGNFRLIRIDDATASPVPAVNRGLAEARGDVIGVMIDGARIVTPGLLHFARYSSRFYPNALVAALGWYVGYDFQGAAIASGYDKAHEDKLLDSIGWPDDGYRLFEIGTMDESSVNGWLAPIAESNGLFLHREAWNKLGGMDERFDLPGGGLVNLDTFRRAIELPDAELVVLLGEGTFHQLHDGVSTNEPVTQFRINNWIKFDEQYQAIRGQHYSYPHLLNPPTYVGTLPRSALVHLVRSALYPVPHQPPALGPNFDPALWAISPPARPFDPVAAALVDLAHTEFRAGRHSVAAAVARLIRERMPEEPEPQRLLALVCAWLKTDEPPSHLRIDYHLALGDAYRILDETNSATAHYRAALAIDSNLVRAHVGLATMRLSGDFYYDWIRRFYTRLKPETIIEIGVHEGRSLSYAEPPTLAIGVDPNPKVIFSLRASTYIFPETSDSFFARRRPEALLGGRPLGIGFVDGLHLYEQALKDFINLERHCGQRSVILFHDTVPLDEPTQRRTCDTQFHTGDVWKTVLCLKHYRPDLDVFTIATPWTGLTVVIGLEPNTPSLADRYDDAVARFMDVPFSDIEKCMGSALNIVPNDWRVVEARLKARGIL